MNRSIKLGGVVLAVTMLGLTGCSNSADTSKGLDKSAQAQIDGLQARVTSLENRVTWVEVIGRKVIAAAPTKYTEQLTTDVAALQADFATAQSNAAAAQEQVAASKAAAQTAIADAKSAVDAAVAAEKAQDAALVDAIETAGQKVADARAAFDAFKQKLQDALGSASPSSTASPSAS